MFGRSIILLPCIFLPSIAKADNYHIFIENFAKRKCKATTVEGVYSLLKDLEKSGTVEFKAISTGIHNIYLNSKRFGVFAKSYEKCSIYSGTRPIGNYQSPEAIKNHEEIQATEQTQNNQRRAVSRTYQCKAACLDYNRPYSKQHVDIEFLVSAANNSDLAVKAYSAHAKICQKNGWTKRFFDPSCS